MPLPGVEKIVPAVPPPAADPPAQTAADLHVTAGGQSHQQFHSLCAPAHRQGVIPGGQGAEKDFSPAQQLPGPAVASAPGTEDHLVSRANVLHSQMDTAQPVSALQAQRDIRLAALRQTEASDGWDAAVRP